MTPRAADGIFLLEELGLLPHVLPELREGIGVPQDKHHIYSVFEHSVRSLRYAAEQNYSLEVRLAALLHDIGKPRTKQGVSPNSTFYNHEMAGAKMTLRAVDRLRFSKDITEDAAHLVRWHMFYYNVGEVSAAGVRRFLARVGIEYVDDLLRVREADRIGSGVPKAVPYKLRHLKFMIDKVRHDPISPKMLRVNGLDIMRLLEIPPSPRVGQILAILLEEVLEDPERNGEEKLEVRIKELGKKTDTELAALTAAARSKKEEFESGLEKEMKQKHHV
ncbi:MAG: HD domain-containing protein [Candidatus Liptonbacteria bacterium]|nr:HD domain-containing protein [Candidatus Liptonbacteria bacterium]